MNHRFPMPRIRALRCSCVAQSAVRTTSRQKKTPTGTIREGVCEIPSSTTAPDSVERIGCRADFDALASLPLDTSIPGARSVKVVLDRLDPAATGCTSRTARSTRFTTSSRRRTSRGSSRSRRSTRRVLRDRTAGSCSARSRTTRPPTPGRSSSRRTTTRLPGSWRDFTTPCEARRVLRPGARVPPDVRRCRARSREAAERVRVVTTDELFEAIDYQPLNLGKASAGCASSRPPSSTPSTSASATSSCSTRCRTTSRSSMGLITEEFQTPLSHVNVLSQNRGTPNMGLREAMSNPELLALEGQLGRARGRSLRLERPRGDRGGSRRVLGGDNGRRP